MTDFCRQLSAYTHGISEPHDPKKVARMELAIAGEFCPFGILENES